MILAYYTIFRREKQPDRGYLSEKVFASFGKSDILSVVKCAWRAIGTENKGEI